MVRSQPAGLRVLTLMNQITSDCRLVIRLSLLGHCQRQHSEIIDRAMIGVIVVWVWQNDQIWMKVIENSKKISQQGASTIVSIRIEGNEVRTALCASISGT